MKLIISLCAIFALSGCASGCREACLLGFGLGNSVFDSIGLAMDRGDPCQTGIGDEARRIELRRPVGYERPSWCGGGRARTTHLILDRNGNTVGKIQ